jgi:precorrin-8X/cobalt-precorrin-8 methylmutase
VARRIVHATADVTFLDSLRFSAGAVAAGVAAVRARRPVVCDVRMLAAGCTHAAGEVVCAVSEPAVIAAARAGGITRAAAAMQHLGDRIEGAIVAVGNAPTALWALLAVAAAGGPRPALVVGLPVGFVGAYESKRDLSRSALPHITNLSPRGGSPAAAAAVNALADLAKHGE